MKKIRVTKQENNADDLKKKLDKALAEVTAIKRQAEGQQGTFDKLTAENKSLNNKLDDYNLLFGDSQKKKV